MYKKVSHRVFGIRNGTVRSVMSQHHCSPYIARSLFFHSFLFDISLVCIGQSFIRSFFCYFTSRVRVILTMAERCNLDVLVHLLCGQKKRSNERLLSTRCCVSVQRTAQRNSITFFLFFHFYYFQSSLASKRTNAKRRKKIEKQLQVNCLRPISIHSFIQINRYVW